MLKVQNINQHRHLIRNFSSESVDVEAKKKAIKAKFDAKKQELLEVQKRPKSIPIYTQEELERDLREQSFKKQQRTLSPQIEKYCVDFDSYLENNKLPAHVRRRVKTVQVNIGLFCNMTCHHCHVESGPTRHEVMTLKDAERVIQLLRESKGVTNLDLTGGAPELCPAFKYLVEEGTKLGLTVTDRSNLTVVFEPGQESLVDYLAQHKVQIIASLPCYSTAGLEAQRGKGAFNLSIQALIEFNKRGYGTHKDLTLDLVYNPQGANLPPSQKVLEAKYKKELMDNFGITFNNLYCVTNMPIKRFYDHLLLNNSLQQYFDLLTISFNSDNLDHTMCKDLININWNGSVYDCDFNQALQLPLQNSDLSDIWKINSLEELSGTKITTGRHCFACTAGQGSS